MKQTENSKA